MNIHSNKNQKPEFNKSTVKFVMLRIALIFSLLLTFSCNTQKDKLKGKWIFEKQLIVSNNQISSYYGDSIGVTEFIFTSDTSGILYDFDYDYKRDLEHYHLNKLESYEHNRFYIFDSLNKRFIRIIPSHLLAPILYHLEMNNDTLILTNHERNYSEQYFRTDIILPLLQ